MTTHSAVGAPRERRGQEALYRIISPLNYFPTVFVSISTCTLFFFFEEIWKKENVGAPTATHFVKKKIVAKTKRDPSGAMVGGQGK